MMMNYLLNKYLERNHSSIQFENDCRKGLSLIKDDLKENEIFLTGENHGVKANRELRIEFLKYFKEAINFKYYLCELPYSMTYFLNMYLRSGDEGTLRDVYRALKGTDAWNQDDYNHWIDLYNYNKPFSREDKIIALGIDIEHQPKNAFKFMENILDDRKNFRKLRNLTERFKENNLKDEEVKNISRDIKKELKDKERNYLNLLKEDYFRIVYVNDNLLNMFEVYSGNNFSGMRDLKMHDNFLRIYNYLSKDKYFGQIGLSHVFKKLFPYVNWFASSLNKDGSPLKDKLVSIAYAYKDCRYLYPTKRKNYVSSIDTLDSSIEEFNGFIKSDYTLFKLNGIDSPFNKKLIWPLSHKFPSEGVTSDYIDYLLVVRESREMLEFKDDFWV